MFTSFTGRSGPGGSAGAAAAEKSSWAINCAGDGIEGGSGGRSCPCSVSVTCSSTPGSVGWVRSPVVKTPSAARSSGVRYITASLRNR